MSGPRLGFRVKKHWITFSNCHNLVKYSALGGCKPTIIILTLHSVELRVDQELCEAYKVLYEAYEVITATTMKTMTMTVLESDCVTVSLCPSVSECLTVYETVIQYLRVSGSIWK